MTNKTIASDAPWYAPFVPPGMKLGGEIGFFIVSMLISVIYAAGYLFRLSNALTALRVGYGGEPPLQVMPMFYKLFDGAWGGYFIVLFCMLGFGIYHFLYYRQDAKSIYTMRRLPDRISFIRYTWTLTVCEVIVCLLFALGCLLISFGLYHWCTPSECLPDGQWRLFWENLFIRS